MPRSPQQEDRKRYPSLQVICNNQHQTHNTMMKLKGTVATISSGTPIHYNHNEDELKEFEETELSLVCKQVTANFEKRRQRILDQWAERKELRKSK